MAYLMNPTEANEMAKFTSAAMNASQNSLKGDCTLGWHCMQAAGNGLTFHTPPGEDGEPGHTFANVYAALFHLQGWACIDQTVATVAYVPTEAELNTDPNRWLCQVCNLDNPWMLAVECSTCKTYWHGSCLAVPMTKCPAGVWRCTRCIAKTQELLVVMDTVECTEQRDRLFQRINCTMCTIDRKVTKLMAKDPVADRACCGSTAVAVRACMMVVPVDPKGLCDKLLIPYDYLVPNSQCTSWIFRAERQDIYSDVQELAVLVWAWSHPDGFRNKFHTALFDTMFTTSPFASVRYQVTSLIDEAPELKPIKTQVRSVMRGFGGGELWIDDRKLIEFDRKVEEAESDSDQEVDEATKLFIDEDRPILGHGFYAAAVDHIENYPIVISSALLEVLSEASMCPTIEDAQAVIELSLTSGGLVGLCLSHTGPCHDKNRKVVAEFVAMMNKHTGMSI